MTSSSAEVQQPSYDTLSSIEDWFWHQGNMLDWRQQELDYAYSEQLAHADTQKATVSFLSMT